MPSDLWTALSQYVTAVSLPNDVPLASVMENWINQAGYPVVEVSVSGDDVLVSQVEIFTFYFNAHHELIFDI